MLDESSGMNVYNNSLIRKLGKRAVFGEEFSQIGRLESSQSGAGWRSQQNQHPS